MKDKKPCINCGEELGKGKSKFCSTDCKYEHHHPKRNCLECGIQLDKEYKYCSTDCKNKIRMEKYYSSSGTPKPPQRYCKECGIEVGRNKCYCEKHHPRTNNCKEDGCDEVVEYMKHYCEEHSTEKKHQQHLNEVKICNGCGVDIGKRKDVHNKQRCDDCREISREKKSKYRTKYYKDRYNNDLEYREKHKVSVMRWRDKKKKEMEYGNG